MAVEDISTLWSTGWDIQRARGSSLKALGRGEMAIWIGLHESSAVFDGNALLRNEISIRGSFCYRVDEFTRALDLINQGDVIPF